MSVAEIKAGLANLTDDERKEVVAYLAELDELFSPSIMAELSAKLNDKNPARWVSLEDISKHLGD